jgi:hypothetical protein
MTRHPFHMDDQALDHLCGIMFDAYAAADDEETTVWADVPESEKAATRYTVQAFIPLLVYPPRAGR